MIKLLSFIGSLLLLPLSVAVTISFYKGVIPIKNISESGLVFMLGALSYCIVHLLLFKLDFLYVLGHELMHAVATFFSGGKVVGFKVSNEGGSVKTTQPNLFVTLAPYLVPGYTIFIAVLYFLFSFFLDVTKYTRLFIFLTGFTLMFHLSYTARSIREKQPDLIKTGYLFSISFVYIINLVVVFCIVSFLFEKASFFGFISGSYELSKEFYYSFWRQLFL